MTSTAASKTRGELCSKHGRWWWANQGWDVPSKLVRCLCLYGRDITAGARLHACLEAAAEGVLDMHGNRRRLRRHTRSFAFVHMSWRLRWRARANDRQSGVGAGAGRVGGMVPFPWRCPHARRVLERCVCVSQHLTSPFGCGAQTATPEHHLTCRRRANASPTILQHGYASAWVARRGVEGVQASWRAATFPAARLLGASLPTRSS
jgi:hypothetical protein